MIYASISAPNSLNVFSFLVFRKLGRNNTPVKTYHKHPESVYRLTQLLKPKTDGRCDSAVLSQRNTISLTAGIATSTIGHPYLHIRKLDYRKTRSATCSRSQNNNNAMPLRETLLTCLFYMHSF